MKTLLIGGVFIVTFSASLMLNTTVSLAQPSLLPASTPQSSAPTITTWTMGDVVLRELPQPAERSQSLVMQSRTLRSLFPSGRLPTARMQQLNATLPSMRSQAPQPINPAEVLQDPGVALERFFSQTPVNPPPVQPLEFFKLPEMSGGVKMNLMQF